MAKYDNCKDFIESFCKLIKSTVLALANLVESDYALVLGIERQQHLIRDIATFLFTFHEEEYHECSTRFTKAFQNGRNNEEKKARGRVGLLEKYATTDYDKPLPLIDDNLPVETSLLVPSETSPFVPSKNDTNLMSIELCKIFENIGGNKRITNKLAFEKKVNGILSMYNGEIDEFIRDEISSKSLDFYDLKPIIEAPTKFKASRHLDPENCQLLSIIEKFRELMPFMVIYVGMAIGECGICNEPCNHCTEKCVVGETEFFCASHNPPQRCSAINYMLHTISDAIFALEKTGCADSFEYNVKKEIETMASSIAILFRRCIRIPMHICAHHPGIFEKVDMRTHLFEKFAFLATEASKLHQFAEKDTGMDFVRSVSTKKSPHTQPWHKYFIRATAVADGKAAVNSGDNGNGTDLACPAIPDSLAYEKPTLTFKNILLIVSRHVSSTYPAESKLLMSKFNPRMVSLCSSSSLDTHSAPLQSSSSSEHEVFSHSEI
jgi:hypothetical protein